MTATLYLMCGLAGAGKTTLAQKIEQETGAVRLCPDEWILMLIEDTGSRPELDRLRTPVEDVQWSLAQQLLKRGQDVILENGFWLRDERVARCHAAKALGCRVDFHFLDVPRAVLRRRIRLRNQGTSATSLRISDEEIDTWLTWFEKPDDSEQKLYDNCTVHRPEEAELVEANR